jgi:hypothetical protein
MALTFDITERHLRTRHAVVELREQVVVTIQTVDATGTCLPNITVSVLASEPESTSITGVTNERGELSFVARQGFYSVILGTGLNAPIKVGPDDTGERVVLIRHE